MEVVANTMTVIILQYTNVSNQHSVHLKLEQRYMYIISQLGGREGGKGRKRKQAEASGEKADGATNQDVGHRKYCRGLSKKSCVLRKDTFW